MTSIRRNRKVIDEILEVRGRLRFKRREAELSVRLIEIENAYKHFKPKLTELELLRYFPIALVACMESYFRLVIKDLVDSGEPYLSNSSGLFHTNQFDFDVLKGLHGQTITIGDVISRYPSISNIRHIVKLMDDLMGYDFREKLSSVYDRWEVEAMESPKQSIIRDIHETFRYVERSFQLRHVFCHEIATAIDVEKEEIDKCVYHTSLFLKASDELVSETLFPNAPLTQTDMNIASYEDYRKEEKDLALLLKKVTEVLSSKQKEKFYEANEAWRKFVEASVEVEGLVYEGGSIRPTIENGAAAQFTRERKEQVEKLFAYLNEL